VSIDQEHRQLQKHQQPHDATIQPQLSIWIDFNPMSVYVWQVHMMHQLWVSQIADLQQRGMQSISARSQASSDAPQRSNMQSAGYDCRSTSSHTASAQDVVRPDSAAGHSMLASPTHHPARQPDNRTQQQLARIMFPAPIPASKCQCPSCWPTGAMSIHHHSHARSICHPCTYAPQLHMPRPSTRHPLPHQHPLTHPPAGVRKEVDVDGREVLLFWYRNQIYCIQSRSPAEGAYSEGFIRAKFTQDFCIECPSTGSLFSLKDGSVVDWYPNNAVLKALTPKDQCRPLEVSSS
jgi:nitrite reductase/ring-hydroxylating ferredoxin subunit